jgi:hypothetical protein
MATLDVALDADSLLRSAQERAYHHPPEFGGFRAALRVQDGGSVAEGTVTVGREGAPEIALDADAQTLAWARHELGSMAAHRRHRSYEDGDGRHPKRLAPDDGSPLGRLVVLEDELASTFRVRDGELSEISRSHGGARFTIVIQERVAAPDGRSVSSAFTVLFRDEASGALTSAHVYADGHEPVGGLLLPASRQVVTADGDGVRVRRLDLSEHELLAEDRS